MADNNTKETLHFQYLGPKDDIESIEVYEEALDYAFSNSKIKNVAITGSYGAGKSSLLETYKRRKGNEKRFLHISLTHFENEQEDKQELEMQLESKIINQLAHKIGAEKLKDSSIVMKKKPKWYSVVLWTALIFVLLVCTLYIKNYVAITKIYSKDAVLLNIKTIMTTKKFFIVMVCAEIFGMLGVISYIVNAQMKHRFFGKSVSKTVRLNCFRMKVTNHILTDIWMKLNIWFARQTRILSYLRI